MELWVEVWFMFIDVSHSIHVYLYIFAYIIKKNNDM